MFSKPVNECKECGAKLWSNFSKVLGYCPECNPAEDLDLDATDLETQLENLTNENRN